MVTKFKEEVESGRVKDGKLETQLKGILDKSEEF